MAQRPRPRPLAPTARRASTPPPRPAPLEFLTRLAPELMARLTARVESADAACRAAYRDKGYPPNTCPGVTRQDIVRAAIVAHLDALDGAEQEPRARRAASGAAR